MVSFNHFRHTRSAMKYIDTSDLALWASKPTSKAELPLLISRLIRSTTTRLTSLSIPKGKGTYRGGWDGVVISPSETEFVPEGLSLWEFGTTRGAAGKAEGDFEKRTQNPEGYNIAQATYIFVTPHVWEGADELAKQTNSILLIAKLDRLSRNLTFVSTLMDTKVKFICADMPDANELTIHIFGALAQWERKRISSRTKDAMAQLKNRGVKLGTPENFTDTVRKMGPAKIKEIANNNANNQKAKKVINLLSKNGKSLREIATELNEAGFKTSRGNAFQPEQVRRLISKAA
jgi:hypothetical protein